MVAHATLEQHFERQLEYSFAVSFHEELQVVFRSSLTQVGPHVLPEDQKDPNLVE